MKNYYCQSQKIDPSGIDKLINLVKINITYLTYLDYDSANPLCPSSL